METNPDPFQLLELKHAKRILLELMGDSLFSINAPFIYAVDSTEPGVEDYYERIKEPMWMTKMENKFDCSVYQSISEFVCDFRLMLFNCYMYNDADTRIFKMASRLERVFEQKLTLLPRDVREKTTLNVTLSSAEQKEEAAATQAYSRRARGPESGGNAFFRAAISSGHDVPPMQALAFESLSANASTSSESGSVKEAVINALRSWEHHREELRLLNTWDEWASERITPFNKCVLRNCVALPQLTQLLTLAAEALCIPTSGPGSFSALALEWALLTPRSSALLARIVSSLMARHLERARLHKTTSPISYSVWEERLSTRVANWYRLLPAGMEHFTSEIVDQTCSRLGFESSLVRTLGWKNPLHPIGEKHFHELTLLQRIYLVKALADWCVTCQDSLRQQLDTSCAWDNVTEHVLGSTRMLPAQDVWIFVHFPGFDDTARFRVYRRPQHPQIIYRVEAPPVLSAASKKRRRKTEQHEPVNIGGKHRGARASLLRGELLAEEDKKEDSDVGRLAAKRPRLDDVKESAVERRRNMSCRYKLRGVVNVDPYENEQALFDRINSCKVVLEDDSQPKGNEVALKESEEDVEVPVVAAEELFTLTNGEPSKCDKIEQEVEVPIAVSKEMSTLTNGVPSKAVRLNQEVEVPVVVSEDLSTLANGEPPDKKEQDSSSADAAANCTINVELNSPEQTDATSGEFELVAENLGELRALINSLTEVCLREQEVAPCGDGGKRKVKKKLLDVEEEPDEIDTDTTALLSNLELLAAEWESVLAARLLPNERRIKLHLRREDEALRMQEERLLTQDGTNKCVNPVEQDELGRRDEEQSLSNEQASARRRRHELRRRKLSEGFDAEAESFIACHNGGDSVESSVEGSEEAEDDNRMRESSNWQDKRRMRHMPDGASHRRSARAIAASQRQRETFRRFYGSESSNDSSDKSATEDDDEDDDYGSVASDIKVQSRGAANLVYGRGGRPRGRPRGSVSNLGANRRPNHDSDRFWRAPSLVASSTLIRNSANNNQRTTLSAQSSRWPSTFNDSYSAVPLSVRNMGGVSSALPSPSEGLPVNRAISIMPINNRKYIQAPISIARSVVCTVGQPQAQHSLVTTLSSGTYTTVQNVMRVVQVENTYSHKQQAPQLSRQLQQTNLMSASTQALGNITILGAQSVSQGLANMNTLTQTVASVRGSITSAGTGNDAASLHAARPLVQLLSSQPSTVSSSPLVKTNVSLADLLQLLRSNASSSAIANSTVMVTTTGTQPEGPILQSPPRLPPLSKHNVVPLGAHSLQLSKSTSAVDAGSDVQLPLDIEATVLRLLHSSSSTSPIQAPASPSIRFVSVAQPMQQPQQQQQNQVIILPPGTSIVSAGPQQVLLLQAAPTSGVSQLTAPIVQNIAFQQQKPTAYVQPQVQLRPQICAWNSLASQPQPPTSSQQQQQQPPLRTVKLYKVGDTLFTSEGEPVCIDNKVLRYLPKDSIEPGLLTLAANMIKEAQRKASFALNSVTSNSQ